MKKQYTTPEIEITRFQEQEKILMLSGDFGSETGDNFVDIETSGWE